VAGIGGPGFEFDHGGDCRVGLGLAEVAIELGVGRADVMGADDELVRYM
jgi:hypothetical protein